MPQLDERFAVATLVVGLVIAVIGFVWLVVRLLPVLRDLIVRGFKPGLLTVIGLGIAFAPMIVNRLMPEPVNEKAVTKAVPTAGGATAEVLALTGAKPSEYEVLRTKKTFAGIKWANPDVTDELVELLRGMDDLRDLDLNSSQITDKSLEVLAGLPKLESLKLLGTKITDDGFRKHILPLAGLKRLELTNTAVKGPTAREWKAAAPDRELVR